MDWSDHQPEHIPRYVWMQLVFRWGKSLDQAGIHAEMERHRQKAQEVLRIEIEARVKKENERETKRQFQRRLHELKLQEKTDKRKRFKAERQEERRLIRERLEREKEERRVVRLEKRRQKALEARRSRNKNSIFTHTIEEVDRHVVGCGLCLRAGNLCKTGRALLKLHT